MIYELTIEGIPIALLQGPEDRWKLIKQQINRIKGETGTFVYQDRDRLVNELCTKFNFRRVKAVEIDIDAIPANKVTLIDSLVEILETN